MTGESHASGGSAPDSKNARVGLCSICAHAAPQKSARGSLFWRCLAAEDDTRLLRYPPLPVTRCHAFERAA